MVAYWLRKDIGEQTFVLSNDRVSERVADSMFFLIGEDKIANMVGIITLRHQSVILPPPNRQTSHVSNFTMNAVGL